MTNTKHLMFWQAMEAEMYLRRKGECPFGADQKMGEIWIAAAGAIGRAGHQGIDVVSTDTPHQAWETCEDFLCFALAEFQQCLGQVAISGRKVVGREVTR